MTLPPLIITSAVHPSDQHVALSSSKARVEHTLSAIGQWLQLAPKLPIVLCDGSGFDFSPIIASRFPNNQIECLVFLNDGAAVRLRGKGYGEGEIMRHALMHAKLLIDAHFFAKCTSKLWVGNFHDCLKQWNGRLMFQAKISNILKFKPLIFRHIDTRFYMMNRDLYLRDFQQAYWKVDDAADHSLEHCFREVIQHQQMQGFLSPTPFCIYGYSGTTGDFFEMSRRTYLTERFKLAVLHRRTNWVSADA